MGKISFSSPRICRKTQCYREEPPSGFQRRFHMNAMEEKEKTLANSRQPCGHNRNVHGYGSFHKKASPPPPPMRRPNTHPELLNRKKEPLDRSLSLNLEAPSHFGLKAPPAEPKDGAKLLVKVNVSQSIGSLRLLVRENFTVSEVIMVALDLYSKERRRPVLSNDPLAFELHYSQFSIDSLNPTDKIKYVGSRNFFLCPKACASGAKQNGVKCGGEVEKYSGAKENPWCKLLDCFLLLL